MRNSTLKSGVFRSSGASCCCWRLSAKRCIKDPKPLTAWCQDIMAASIATTTKWAIAAMRMAKHPRKRATSLWLFANAC